MNVIDLLSYTARRVPDKIAVDDLRSKMTFRELDELSTAIARQISRVVGKTCVPVPVMMEKSVFALVAFLAVAKAGCFYVPIGKEQPEKRIKGMLDILNPDILIVDAEEDSKLEFPGIPIACIDLDSKRLMVDGQEAPSAELATRPLETDPVYAIFTSGSTGTPKCVVKDHASIVTFISDFICEFGISDEDVIGNQAPFDFDVSAKDIYTCIASGATLVLLPKKFFSFPAQLLDTMIDKRVSVLVWAVSAIRIVSAFGVLASPDVANVPLRLVAFSGEVIEHKHLRNWLEAFPDAQIVNMYAPTEITCNCTFWRVPRPLPEGKLPIGRAFRGARVLVRRTDGSLADVGEKGEICVQGPYVALGYYMEPEKTASVFVQLSDDTGYRAIEYRTGDIGYYGDDGELYFCGRNDNQIKLNGHRIELEEVECAFADMDGLSRCICLLDEGKQRMTLVYSTPDGGELEPSRFAEHARKALPKHMVPTAFEPVREFPLTRNGKIDRRALSARLNGE